MEPLDGSSFAELSLIHAIALAGRFQAELVLVHIGRSSPAVVDIATSEERLFQESAEDCYLDRIAQSAEIEGVCVRVARLAGRPGMRS